LKIEVKNITKEYVQGDQRIVALKDCSLTVTEGSFICITGRSGSGKSTLLNIMAGLTIPTSGSVLLDGQNIFSLSDNELSLYRNAKVGILPQQQSVLSNLTALDNVRLPYHLARREGDSAEEARRLLTLVGIGDLEKKMPKRMSGGQLKRVAIARALINNPCLLLADEPTGDLDSETTGEIINIFKRMTDEGIAILMVTHDLDTTGYANIHYQMKDGILSAAN